MPGTALDAGCGEGAEAIWLAEQGWQVTAADISAEALARATERASASPAAARLAWVGPTSARRDPDDSFDLVTTHYAHPAMPQLAFYERIAAWVAPGGTLLVVGHLQDPERGRPRPRPRARPRRSRTASLLRRRRSPRRAWSAAWTRAHGRSSPADEPVRVLDGHGKEPHDVVVRARRRTPDDPATEDTVP